MIVVSDFVKDCFKEFNLKLFRVYNGIDVSKFCKLEKGKFRKELDIDKNTFLIGTVSFFTPTKGHEVFIEIAALIKKSLTNVKFIVVGDNIWGGPITIKSLREFAKNKKIDKDILFMGKRNDVPSVLKDLDLFVSSSENESFGLVLLEAMASGVPVVARNLSGGPCEIVQSGDNGLIVDFSNKQDVANNIVSLLRDSQRRDFFIKAGYCKIKTCFNKVIFIKNIEKVYQDVLKGRET